MTKKLSIIEILKFEQGKIENQVFKINEKCKNNDDMGHKRYV